MNTHEEAFHSSFQRASSSKVEGIGFADALFDNLQRSSPEVASKIFSNDTEAFRSTLVLALVHLASFHAKGGVSTSLEEIARRQSRTGRNIAPHLYELFLTAVLQTVRRYDPEFDAEIEKAWNATLRPGLEYQKKSY